MRDLLFRLQPTNQSGLQAQIREQLVSAILGGQIPSSERLPSSRKLANVLGVSRNTVTLAYQGLIDDGILVARERSGYYVNDVVMHGRIKTPRHNSENQVDWSGRLRVRPSRQDNIYKPPDWPRYPFPFIYGQVDQKLFPIAEWRDCSRRALGRQWLEAWAADLHANDDPMLIEQIRTQLLPRRGIWAREDEILITLGAQQALYLLASLLLTPQTRVGLENPGYPDVRNILQLRTDDVLHLPVDDGGLIVDDRLDSCNVVYTTPSHQAPTTVTMPQSRRQMLLKRAAEHDFLVVEDDYEPETNFVSTPNPALKSLDRRGRVIYVSSLSKTLFPGLRLGFIVAAPEVIREARALRRLMVRHPPSINQRTTALFLSRGHHDALIMRLNRSFGRRWRVMRRAIDSHMPEVRAWPSFGGSSVWMEGPAGLDANRLAREALEEGVILEPGDIYFADKPPPQNSFRLGFSSIEAVRIEEGIARIAALLRRQMAR